LKVSIRPTGINVLELELQDIVHQYLYSEGGVGYYLNPKTLEEITVPLKLLNGNLGKILEGGAEVKIRMDIEKPIFIHSSNRLHRCTVAEVVERKDRTAEECH
jgi:translation elongation factor P/translation initiation factor 5A